MNIANIRRMIVLSCISLLFVASLSAPAFGIPGQMAPYCSAPPFLNNVVSPNILIMMDNSGSMNDHPYNEPFDPTQFNSGLYYGYFDATKMYQYKTSGNLWQIYSAHTPTADASTTQPIASGSLLNWAATRKLEVAKKLLAGGNPGFLCGGSQCTSATCVGSSTCVANPRTVATGSTILLYSEDASGNNNVSFDASVMSDPTYSNYLVSDGSYTYNNVIYPFNDAGAQGYTFKLGSGGCASGRPACSSLTISANNSVNSRVSSPITDRTITSNWFRMNNLTTTTTGSYATFVDETTQDQDATTIANQKDKNPIVFDITPITTGTGTIQDVNVIVVAREVASSSGACGTKSSNMATLQFNALLTLGSSATTTWPATFQTLNRTTRNYNKYATYSFTYSTNPKTGATWTWNDILSTGTGTVNKLTGVGIQNYSHSGTDYNGSTVQTCYMNVTQVFVRVDVYEPSGGPYSVVVDTGKTTIANGIIDQFTQGSSQARFGLAQYDISGNNDGGRIVVPIDFNDVSSHQTTSIADAVMKYAAVTNTPLAETEYELLSYYSQTAPRYPTSGTRSPKDYTVVSDMTTTTVNWDPYYYRYSKLPGSSSSDAYVQCAKSYIIMLTDGEPTADTTFPSGTPVTDTNGNGDRLDELALWGRTTDMRPGSCGGPSFPCIPGTQNVFTYTVFLFGTGSELLQSTAINGGFNGNAVAGVSPQPALVPPCQNKAAGHPTQDELKDCYLPNMSDGTVWLITTTTSTTDPITLQTVDVEPPTPIGYYEGSDAYQLQTSISQTIADILKRAASGTAVSVLTTSARGVGSMLQAYFLPSRQDGAREVEWTGFTQNLWIDPQTNLREDTMNDSAILKDLQLNEDNVLMTFFDTAQTKTMAAMFTTDTDGNSNAAQPGSLASCQAQYVKDFENVNYLWEGGLKLALQRPSTRTIFTSSNVISTGTSTTTTTFSPYTFDVTTVTANATMQSALTATTMASGLASAFDIVKYIRGECLETGVTGDTACGDTLVSNIRDRRITQKSPSVPIPGGDPNGNVWKLGDIITSTPKVFGTTPLNAYHLVYGDNTYRDYVNSTSYSQRSSIAFIGANDGMVHAFRVGFLNTDSLTGGVKGQFKNFFNDSGIDRLGEEVWGYIPFNAFPYLQFLASTSYGPQCHVYFNDLPVYLVDVSTDGVSGDPTALKTSSSWRSLLIGGMRYGGACKNGDGPSNPPGGSGATVGFSSFFAIDITDPEHPVPLWEYSDQDMGYATSFPAILREGNSGANGYWYLTFGSGSKKLPYSTHDLGRSSTGYLYILDLRNGNLVKKIALDHKGIVGDVISVDADLNYETERIYFGTSYLYSGTTGSWNGKIVAVDVPTGSGLSTGGTTTTRYLFTGQYPFTAAPAASLDTQGMIWVYAGSGKYELSDDQTDASQQVFVGFKDMPGSGATTTFTYPLTTANLSIKTSATTTGTVTGTTQECMYSSTTNTFSNQTLVTAITSSVVQSAAHPGWYIQLGSSPTTTGERVICNPLAMGGLVDYLTFVPNSDACSGGGTSYLCAVGATTGTPPPTVAILSPAETSLVTSGTVTLQRCVALGPGAPPKNDCIIVPPIQESSTSSTSSSSSSSSSGSSSSSSGSSSSSSSSGKSGPPEGSVRKIVQVSTGAMVTIENNPTTSIFSKVVEWLRK